MNQFRSAYALPQTFNSADAARMIRRAVRRAIPALCDFCLVHVVVHDRLVPVAIAHQRRDGARLLREITRLRPLRTSDPQSSVARVVRTRTPLIRPEILPEPESLTGGWRERRERDLHRRLATRSALVVPVMARDSMFGALSLCYAHSGRRYAQPDLVPARRLARQIGDMLILAAQPHGSLRLRSATGHARQGPALRRRVAPRN